jgi:poly-beta-1,6-N-acetyl-D-glucosamine synthase
VGEGTIALAVFWIALCFVVYTYAGYPALLYILTCWCRAPVGKDAGHVPFVSFLIVAHNEEKVIARKLRNCLAFDYPADHLQINVASDGSTDDTNDIVRGFHEKGVALLAFPKRMGKAHTLNQAIPLCQADIVVLSDARQMFAPTAVRELVANFADPGIGAVTGDLQFEPSPQNKNGEQIGLYWRYEKWIRTLQSRYNSTTVVTGAIYAIRKPLFRSIPRTCIADDLAVPMTVVMQGYRVIFDPSAKASDRYSRTFHEEFQRRVRTIAGSYQYLLQTPKVLSPKTNGIWFDFLSHKVCRIVAPFALCGMLAANMALLTLPYRVVLVLQLAFYSAAGLGAMLATSKGGRVPKVLSAPHTFVMLNLAAAVALFRLLAGSQTNLWEKAENLREASG